MDLVKAAFWLTSFGCCSLREGKIVLASPYRVALEYELPRAIAGRGSLDDFSIPGAASQDHEDGDSEELDVEFEENVASDEGLEEVPRLSPAQRTSVIAFLRAYLTRAVLAGLDEQDQEDRIGGQVDQLLQYFFCNIESQVRCSKAHPDVNRQVELWNRLGFDAEDRTVRKVTAKTISILAIPAFEARGEQALSRQKRIMGHSRVKSSSDLLLARFVFDSKDV
jgi:hypothetical protein